MHSASSLKMLEPRLQWLISWGWLTLHTVEQSPRPSSRTIVGGFLLLTVDTRREKQTQAQHLTYFCQTHQLLWYSTRYWYPYSSRQCMDRLICRYIYYVKYEAQLVCIALVVIATIEHTPHSTFIDVSYHLEYALYADTIVLLLLANLPPPSILYRPDDFWTLLPSPHSPHTYWGFGLQSPYSVVFRGWQESGRPGLSSARVVKATIKAGLLASSAIFTTS